MLQVMLPPSFLAIFDFLTFLQFQPEQKHIIDKDIK